MPRGLLIALAFALFLLASIGALESQCILSGWWHGEAFWQGRPTSYWMSRARSYTWIPVYYRDDDGKPLFTSYTPERRVRVPTFLPDFVKAQFLGEAVLPGGLEGLAVLEEMRLRLRDSEDENDRCCVFYLDSKISTLQRDGADVLSLDHF